MDIYRFRNIRTKIIYWFLFIAVSQLIVISAGFVIYQTGVYGKYAAERLKAVRDIKTSEINLWLDRISGDMNTISSSEEMRTSALRLCAGSPPSPAETTGLKKLFSSYLNNYTVYSEFFIISSMSGRIVYSTNPDALGDDRSSYPYFTEPLKNGTLYIKDIYFSKNLNIPTMTFSIPLLSAAGPGGKPAGVLVARIFLERSLYSGLLDRTGLGSTGETLIVNRDRIVLNKLRFRDTVSIDLKLTDEAAIGALSGEHGFAECTDYRGLKVLAAYAYIPSIKWGIITKQDVSEIYSPLFMGMIYIFIFMIFSTGLVFLVSYRISENISKPLTQMITVSSRIKSGDLTARNNLSRDDDLGFLANSFDGMADSILAQLNIEKKSSEIIEVIVSAMDPAEFSNSVLLKLIETTGSNLGAFYVLSGDGNRFIHRNSIGLDENYIENFHAGKMEGEFGKALATQKITVTGNIQEESMIKLRTVIGDLVPKAVITIPVIVKNRSAAVFSLARLDDYPQETVDILNHIRLVMNTAYSNILAVEETMRLARELGEKNNILESQKHALQSQALELKNQRDRVRRQNIQLEREHLKVDEANRLKSEFLSNMSHELRTPLNSILSLSRVLIRQSKGKLTVEEAGYLEVIDRNGEKLLELINDILDLSKIEAGRIDLKPKKFSIRYVLNIIIENLEQLAEEKNIFIKMVCGNNIPEIESDESRVYQILQNILSNAVKFTGEGGVTVSVAADDSEVTVSIADTGIGIEEKNLSHIFEEFRQIDGSLSRKYDGTGLGLAIALKSAQLVSAMIEVKSTPGSGSVFTVSFPLKWMEGSVGRPDGSNENPGLRIIASAPQPSIENSSEILDQSGPSPEDFVPPASDVSVLPQAKILIVDDDPDNLISINAVLKDFFEIVVARDGLEAVTAAVNERPDLILLDMAMPGISGFDVVKQLKLIDSTKHIPVVALTALTMKGDRERVLAAGCDGYIPKPYKIDILLDTIRRSLRGDPA